jgi:predicted dienelactone hydrolase
MALPIWRAVLKRALWPLQKNWAYALGGGAIAVLAIVPPASSAERIEFFVGPLEPVILVEDLEAFAQDGTINDSLQVVADNIDAARLQALRGFLNAQLDVELVTVSQFTYWPLGERLLGQVGQLVQTNDQQNGWRPLRAALLAAAADGDGLTPLEVIQAFPLEVIQLDLALLQQLLQDNQTFSAARAQVSAQLRAIADREAAAFSVPTDDRAPTRPGPYQWRRQGRQFDHPLRSERVPFDIYLPRLGAQRDPVPVVVISHGAASGRRAFAYLAEHLASHGYAVVVPEHEDNVQRYEQFLTGGDRPPSPSILINRSRDISLVLDELERLGQRDPTYANLDVSQVGVFGHSLGGFTALTTAGAEFDFDALRRNCPAPTRAPLSLNLSRLAQCDLLALAADAPFQLSDQRIQAVFALSPPTSLFFGERGLSAVTVPTLFMAAAADNIVPAIPEQVLPYQRLGSSDRYLVMVENATHFTFLQGGVTGGVMPLPRRLVGPNPQLAQPYLKALGLAFFDRHLRQQADAEGYLTQTYLDTLATEPFRAAIARTFRTE